MTPKEYGAKLIDAVKKQLGPTPTPDETGNMVLAMLIVAAGICVQTTDGTEEDFVTAAKNAFIDASRGEATTKAN